MSPAGKVTPPKRGTVYVGCAGGEGFSVGLAKETVSWAIVFPANE
jgi:hypothetical protein